MDQRRTSTTRRFASRRGLEGEITITESVGGPGDTSNMPSMSTASSDRCTCAWRQGGFANGGYLPVPEGADLGAVPRSEVILLRREA